jgi:hypothetical protein
LDLQVVRKDPNFLESNDIVVDVGELMGDSLESFLAEFGHELEAPNYVD